MSSITVPTTTSSSRLRGRFSGKSGTGRKLPLGKQLLLQLLMLAIAFIVLFPILWIVSLSIDPSGISRPTELRLIPPGATLQAYKDIIAKPTNNPVSLPQLFFNSVKLAGGTTVAAVMIGIFAAYAFSRFRFVGRSVLMIGVITVLMLPSIATLPALFVLLNKVQVAAAGFKFNLRDSLWGVGLAMTSGALPFAIWNLKGFLDTIPKELEEAALIDGANANQTFFRIILPLAVPALAVTAFVGFMGGWTEFAISWQFLTNPKDFTLTMALWNMTGQYAGSVPWSHFAAMSIIIALPVSIVYLLLQKYIVSGLTIGGVKG